LIILSAAGDYLIRIAHKALPGGPGMGLGSQAMNENRLLRRLEMATKN